MSTLTTPTGRTVYPYNYAKLSFVATFDGEERAGFCFVLNQEADKVAAGFEKRGARCLVGRTAVVEQDDEAGFPDFRSYIHALDRCDSARRIGSEIVVLWARS